jgi:hypothetical protein
MIKLQQAGQQMQRQAQQLLQQADAEIARLKADNVRLKERGDEKQGELVIDEYKAETERLKAVGNVDPLALQLIVRRMVSDMLQTDLPGWITHHGQMEQALQANVQAAQPQPPPQGGNGGGNGATPPGAPPGPGNGGMPPPGPMQ